MYQFTGFADEASQKIDEQIAVLKTLGWKAIEIRGLDGKNMCDHDDASFYAAVERFKSAGISIFGFGSQLCNWARPITTDFSKDTDELKRNIPRMQKTGAKLIRIMSYPNAKDKPWDDAAWKKEVFRRIGELAKMAEAGGITLVHENCDGYAGKDAAHTFELLDAVKSPALKLVFDTGNTTSKSGSREASWEFFNAVREHVVHIHIKACKHGPDGKWITCFPDEDPVQEQILRSLRINGYRGWLSIEPHMKAVVHAGQEASDTKAASALWIEYGKRIEALAAKA